MAEHLDDPRISALLDDPASDRDAVEHLDECAACRGEFENLRRTRMALSAMDDLAPPAGQWEEIESELEARGLIAAGGSSNGAGGAASADGGSGGSTAHGAGEDGGWRPGLGELFSSRGAWLRVAAALLLFTGGMVLGTRVPGPSSAADADRSALSNRLPGDQPGQLASTGATGEDLSYEPWLRRLERLRASGPTPEEAMDDPEEAAEHLARLDALIRGARDYVQEMPADARLNDFLFEVVEDRQALNDALQMASLEYR